MGTSVEQTDRTRIVRRNELAEKFAAVRRLSEELCRPLATEDYVVQTIDDVSPPKWHLGHTTWFFERVVLQQFEPGFVPHNEIYYFVFNSYYLSFGDRLERPMRGTVPRPTVKEVMDYRQVITQRVVDRIDSIDEKHWPEFAQLIVLGINHEQQHQELFITDIKHIFASCPLQPVYSERSHLTADQPSTDLKFILFEGGTHDIGANGAAFAYDNEYPQHTVYLDDFKLANRPVTCGEYHEFINDNGYKNHHLWLSDAWDLVQAERWEHPLYWENGDNGWQVFTLSGRRPLDLNEPVCHVSYYEAAAFARWAGKRLPTEPEWEIAASEASDIRGTENLLDERIFHPVSHRDASAQNGKTMYSLLGDVWEWTGSAYLPYPGYRQSRDALGEYNGKFMSNQMVLRGGSCATPRDHVRITYRNFFQPEKRWQFTGLRLAEDL